jgi:urea carboxylase
MPKIRRGASAPSSGLLAEARFGGDFRVDVWIETGSEVTPHYDPLLAKIVAVGPDREAAITRLSAPIGDSAIWGIESNLSYLVAGAGGAGLPRCAIPAGAISDRD